ncbi:MAG: TolC family protein [Armatimonadetes bacterium]|nr:TolC family protein [Armatimonadota bacterium]
MQIGRHLFALLLLFSAAAAAAPAEDAGRPWTLEECIRTAWARHGDSLAADENTEAARAQLRGASSSLWFPTLSARSTRNQSHTEAQQGGTSIRRTGDTSDTQHTLTATVSLWDGGTQHLAVRQARAGQISADESRRRTRQLLAYSVTSAYVGLLRAQHALDVANREIEQARETKRVIQGLIDAGTRAEVDIYPIDAQLASARVSQIRAASDARVAASALRNAMGLDAGPAPKIQEMPQELPEAPALDQCREQALADRPDVLQSMASTDRNRASLALARLRTLPQLTSGARYDRGLGNSSVNMQWSINAVLSWSFYDRGDRAAVQSTEAGLRATEAQHDQLLRDIVAEIEQAHLDLASARERVDAARASVAAARKNLDVVQARFEQDLAIPLEIVDAQVTLRNAELQAIGARYDYFLARAQLDRAMGRDYE